MAAQDSTARRHRDGRSAYARRLPVRIPARPRDGPGPSTGRRPRRAGARGLTFIELLVVLLVLAIALQLTAPGFSRSIADYRSAAAMDSIVTLLATARQEALLSGRAITVCAADTSGACRRSWDANHEITVFEDRNEDRHVDAGDRIVRRSRWPLTGGELSWRASLARPYLRFETTGGTWQNGTLYYCPVSRDARQARALVLSHSGRSYRPGDANGDGIREDRQGRNLRC